MGKSKNSACLSLIPVLEILLIITNISIFSLGPEEQKLTKQQEIGKLTEIKKKIKDISAKECFAAHISILNVKDDGSMYLITIYPKFEPGSYDQIQTWTDSVCKSSKSILDNYDVVRDISVWAIRPSGHIGDGWVIVYGRTFYDHRTDTFEFNNAIEGTPFLDWKDQKKEERPKFYALHVVSKNDVRNAKNSLGLPDKRYAEILPNGQIVLQMEDNFIDCGEVICRGEKNFSLEGWFNIQEKQNQAENYAWMIIQRESINRFLFFPESYIWWGDTGVNRIRITNLGTESLLLDAVIGYGMKSKGG
ncbi:MAG: hypothetical protein ACTSQ8_24790 [Candidatus Helarchaeota archaeon]